MTLIVGMKVKDGLLLSADKMVTSDIRIFRTPTKLFKIKNLPIIVSASGSVASAQAFIRLFKRLLMDNFEEDDYSLDGLDDLLFSKEFRQIGFNLDMVTSKFTAFILATSETGEKIYRVFPNSVEEYDGSTEYLLSVVEEVPEEGYYCLGGSGSYSGANLFTELYFQINKEIPDKKTAIRLISLIYNRVGSFDKSVSSEFDVVYAKRGKLYKLVESDVAKISEKMKSLWSKWLEIYTISSTREDIEENLFSSVYNRIYISSMKKQRSVKRHGKVVIIDNMFSKRQKVYEPLLEYLKEYHVFENIKAVDKIVEFVKDNENRIRFVLLDRILKTREKSLEILNKLKENFPEIPVIIVGRTFTEEDVAEFSECNADGFIEKSNFENRKILNDTIRLVEESDEFISGNGWKWKKVVD